MPTPLIKTDFRFPGQTHVYRGKVRDVYRIQDKVVLVASDRISAFDHILPKGIPYKGQVLNQLASEFLRSSASLVPNWYEASPDPMVSVGSYAQPFKLEMVIRGYLCGHAYREYAEGKRSLCGVPMPDGLKENDPFPTPIITPSTKADEGHDEDISREDILEKQLLSEEDLHQVEVYARRLFQMGTKMALQRGLLLADTKYEFGKTADGQIVLIDEVHTPDSSRYFYKEGYEEARRQGQKPQQLSKEFVREWLMARNFQGLTGQSMPELSDEFAKEVSERYIHLYEILTGKDFIKQNSEDVHQRIEENVHRYLKENL